MIAAGVALVFALAAADGGVEADATNTTSKSAPRVEPPPEPAAPAIIPDKVEAPSQIAVSFFFAGGLYLSAESEVDIGGGGTIAYRLIGDLFAGLQPDLVVTGGNPVPALHAILDFAPPRWFVTAGVGAGIRIPRNSAAPGVRPGAFVSAGLKSTGLAGGRLGVQLRWFDTGVRNVALLLTLSRAWTL